MKARVILVGTAARHSSRLYSSIFAPSDMLVDRKCTYPVSSIQFVLSFEIKHDLSWQIKNCDSEMAATAWRNALIRQGERRSAVLSSWWVVLRWMSRYLGPKRRLQSPQVQESHKKKHKNFWSLFVFRTKRSVFVSWPSAEQLQSNERKCWTNCVWPWSTAPLPNFTVKVGRDHRSMFQSTNNLGDRLQLFRPRTSREVPHGHHFVLGFPWISFHDSSE